MTLDLWHIIITATLDVRLLLDKTLTIAPGPKKLQADPTAAIGPAVQSRLRRELIDKLGELRSSLRALLSEKEAGMVLLPLVIHIDELVMRRLNREEQIQWPLLQKELFDILHGGEVFFEFATERLSKPDTPAILFQVLYFCLSDGFVGTYANEPARIDQFKRMLGDKIPLPLLPVREGRKRRGKEAAETPTVPPMNPRWFYLVALSCVVVLVGLTALLTNL